MWLPGSGPSKDQSWTGCSPRCFLNINKIFSKRKRKQARRNLFEETDEDMRREGYWCGFKLPNHDLENEGVSIEVGFGWLISGEGSEEWRAILFL